MGLLGSGALVCCWGFIFVLNWSQTTGVITLSPCVSHNTAEVIQGSHNTFTCSGLDSSKQVQWTLSYNNTNYNGGSCDPGQECVTGFLGSASTPSRVSSTEVRTVIDPTMLSNTNLVKFGTLRCSQEDSVASCQMDYIVPVGGTCSVQAGRDSSRFQLNGGCTLQTGAQSSRDRYSCQWRSHGGLQTPWQHNVPLTKDNYQTACRVSGQPLPTTSGQYTYAVILLPGRNTVIAAGTVSITRPDTPSVSGCGGDVYILDNTTVTCTCSTNTIGQPQGRLLWVKEGNNSATQTGAYGASSLTVSQTLHRDDHQRSQFRCTVQWTANISAPAVTFKVGYPPTQVSLQLNQRDADITVTEHQTVDFSCQDSNGRPDPTLRLLNKDNSSVLASESSALSHVVVGRCEDSGQYVCTADNGLGSEFTEALALFVTCSPRGVYDVGEVNFIDQPVSVTFAVTAYPVPDEVIFLYLGPTSESHPMDVNDTHIQMTGACGPRPGVVYQSTCIVTVTAMTTQSAAGFYRLSVTNTQGDGEFRLKVLYRVAAESDSPSYFGLAVGACVVLSVVLVIIAFVIIWLRQRHWKLPCAETPASAAPSTVPVISSAQRVRPATPDSLEPVTSEPSDGYLEPIPRREDSPGLYDSLHFSDVGQNSVYSQIASLRQQRQ